MTNYYRKSFGIVAEMIASLFVPLKAKTLVFKDIGLTITIPKGLRILSDDQIKRSSKLNTDESVNSYRQQLANNPNAIPLFFAENAEGSLISGLAFRLSNKTEQEAQQDYDEYIASYWNNLEKTSEFYSRMYLDKQSTKKYIGRLQFEIDEISWRIPERRISSFYSYHSIFKGYQIAFTTAFRNQEFGETILKAIESASFA